MALNPVFAEQRRYDEEAIWLDIEERKIRERKRNVVSGTWIGVRISRNGSGWKRRGKRTEKNKKEEEWCGGGADSDYEMMVRFLQAEMKGKLRGIKRNAEEEAKKGKNREREKRNKRLNKYEGKKSKSEIERCRMRRRENLRRTQKEYSK